MFCSNVPFSLLVFKWSPREPFKDHQGALVLLGAESPKFSPGGDQSEVSAL